MNLIRVYLDYCEAGGSFQSIIQNFDEWRPKEPEKDVLVQIHCAADYNEYA